MRTATILVVVLTLVVSGCFGPTTENRETGVSEEPCSPGYYVGCDDNRDAHYMLETYGLHQFTNSTERLARPVIDDAMIAWVRGGHGDPVWHHAFHITDQNIFTYQTDPDKVQRGVYIFGEKVLVSEHPRSPAGEPPRQGNFNASVLMLWYPLQGEFRTLDKPTDVPLVPSGLDQEWALTTILQYENSHRNGVATLNVNNGEYRELMPIRPNDGSFFGGPLIDSTIGGGYAFLSMLWAFESGEPNAIIQADLETGERTEILNVTGHAIQGMDASDDYLVLQASIDDKSGIWAWSIRDQEWFFVQEERQRAAVHPKVGGDWIVYLEYSTHDDPEYFVGYHVPTASYHVLIESEFIVRNTGGKFGFVSWDTDGEHVVLHLQISATDPITPFKFRGSQLYWMELPVVE